jgi:ribosomal protein S12 methylthiotransferase accessory factor
VIDLDRLIDPRTGIITASEAQPSSAGDPRFWRSHGATVAHTERFAPWRADGFGFGASFGNLEAARGAALGEAAERYCGNAVPAGLPFLSWNDLAARGDDALDPTTLALYATWQYELAGFPFTHFTRDLPVSWVLGRDLSTNEPVWAPASLVYLDGAAARRPDERPTHSLMYSGIAAGTDREHAEAGALDELIERDATTIWWASGSSTVELDDESAVAGMMGANDLDIRLLQIPTDLPGHVIAAVIEDGDPTRDGLLAFGSACRTDPVAAARKAVMEALGLRRVTRQLLDPQSDVWRAVNTDTIDAHVFLPHRADRRYSDDIPDDFRTLADLPSIAQLYLDQRMATAVLPRLRPTERQPLTALNPIAGDRIAELVARGIRVVSIDVTTDDIRACGLTVVRVIAAGLIGNGPPAFPLRGSDRYVDVPRTLGWNRQPASTRDLYPFPLPLA